MPKQKVFLSSDNRFNGLSVETLSDTEAASLIALALAVLAKRHQPGQALGSSDQCRAYLRLSLGDHRAEVFGVIFLDNRHRILTNEVLFHGTLDGASVYPRIVVQRALEINAGAVLLYHNHPSGVAEPSIADETITRRLKSALALVDIRVLDHFVVSAGDSVSFSEKGLL